jgi:hypothetical protein
MKAIIIEIRDRGTFIPALAVRLGSHEEQERWLLAMVGYGRTYEDQSKQIILCEINTGAGRCSSDSYDWPANPRTYRVAHEYLNKHFDELAPGAVVDVEFILKETATPKTTDRHCEVTA